MQHDVRIYILVEGKGEISMSKGRVSLPTFKNIDTRNWSFSARALYELNLQKERQQKKKRRKKLTFYWVKVSFLDLNGMRQEKWFQLPKDLQVATRQSNFQNNCKILNGALINIPLTKYNRKGQTKITTGLITDVAIRKKTTGNPKRITRSQFKKINYWGWLIPTNGKEVYNYLKHNYSPSNRKRIKSNVSKYLYKRLFDLGMVILSAIGLLLCACYSMIQ